MLEDSSPTERRRPILQWKLELFASCHQRLAQECSVSGPFHVDDSPISNSPQDDGTSHDRRSPSLVVHEHEVADSTRLNLTSHKRMPTTLDLDDFYPMQVSED